jgi:hypothetical protein
MSFRMRGDYFEACNCQRNCRCIFGGDFDGDACDGFFSWNITTGAKDGIELSGRRVVLARHRPADLNKDRWTVELYIDDGASESQRDALVEIFGGRAGGLFERFAKKIGPIAAVKQVPIVFEKDGRERRIRVGSALEMEAEEMVGLDGTSAATISNPTSWALVTTPLRQAAARRIDYRGAWMFQARDTNSYLTEFEYAS